MRSAGHRPSKPSDKLNHESPRHRHPETGILDPQGKAIEGALRSLGVAGVASVRQGKVFDIEIEGADRAKAEALLKQAADKLLANTVIENYRVEVVG